MQKSRRALVKRKAAAAAQERVGAAADAGRKRRLYGFSASLVVASWVALLLLNSLVGHGDGQRGMYVWFGPPLRLSDEAWNLP
jgi:hypothetical protein